MNLSYDTSVTTSYALTGFMLAIVIFIWIIMLATAVVLLISFIKLFKRTSKPVVAAIIPIYRELVLCQIADVQWWYVLLLCIPIINIYASYVIYKGIADKFSKNNGFVIGMILLPIVFIPLLAFKGEYKEVIVAEINDVETIDEEEEYLQEDVDTLEDKSDELNI